MDQKFKLVAPRARLAEDYGYQIGELLFGFGWDRGIGIRSSETAERLVDLLAVPVVCKGDRKPVSVEPQPTPQKYSFPNQDQRSDVLVARVIEREASVKLLESHPLEKEARGGQTQYFPSATTLTSLPTELLLPIAKNLELIENVVSLGLVNRRLCGIAQEALRSRFHQYFAPWANKNIACAGDYSAANDFPPGLFSHAELEAFQHEQIESYIEEEQEWRTVSLNRLDDFTYPAVSNIQEQPMLEFSWDIRRLKGLINSRDFYQEYFPTDQPWILRNLTTKQFVRAEAVALKPEYIKGPHITGLGFGEVLLSRICWTSAALEIDEPANIRRGIWAGHCFDITTLTRHERKTTGDAEWTDISNEVVKEIATIWESNLGAGWREIICQAYKT